MKKLIAILVSALIVASLFAGCAKTEPTKPAEPAKPKTKVGMATDSGTIDDKSFNQGTWEGIKRYEDEKKTIEKQYLQPQGQQKTDYVNAINNLVAAGNKIVVTPGFKFETAVNEAAAANKETAFILIDGSPHNGDFKFVKHDNVVSVFFTEHEAGFLAGVATALSSQKGKVGFIGGMEIPPVQKFGWGFKAGVKYANEKFGTKVEVAQYKYQGSFDNVAAGQTLAAGMYSQGIDIIFHAAGGVGVGVITEAKQRAEKGEKVWVVGVDVDQYADGLLKDGKTSVILTSAMKRIDVAAYNYIDAKLNNSFPGGQVITLSLKENGVGLPQTNPNLSKEITDKVEQAKKEVLDGKFKVPSTQAEIDAYAK